MAADRPRDLARAPKPAKTCPDPQFLPVGARFWALACLGAPMCAGAWRALGRILRPFPHREKAIDVGQGQFQHTGDLFVAGIVVEMHPLGDIGFG